MNYNKIAVLDTGYDSYSYEDKLLTGAGYYLDFFSGDRYDQQAKMKFSNDAVGLLIRWTEINDDFLQATPNVRAIVRYGVGYDNINLESASRFNVKVSNVQGYANHAVSDHAIAMMYACSRALLSGYLSIKTKFGEPPIREIVEFHDKTIGIIGLGRIGSTFCKKVGNIFGKVLGADPYIPDENFSSLGAVKTDLNALLENSNVISIHCNLTEETRGLINSETIGLMKKKPILINTSRGPVINESDLYQALKDNRLHSIGLDVFHDEPPLTNCDDLLNDPRVIATGHYAWYSTASAVELQKRAADNLLAMLKGKIPKDCLNP